MIEIICGLPGSGKTTALAAYAVKEMKKGNEVYTNFYCVGCYQLDRDYSKYQYPEGSLLIIDECSLWHDGRDWKSFSKQEIAFFKYHRHMRINIVVASQVYTDVEAKIRKMCANFYYLEKGFFGFTRFYNYKPAGLPTNSKKKDVVTEEELTSCFLLPLPLEKIFCKRIYRPKYYRYFDSYDLPNGLFNPYVNKNFWS